MKRRVLSAILVLLVGVGSLKSQTVGADEASTKSPAVVVAEARTYKNLEVGLAAGFVIPASPAYFTTVSNIGMGAETFGYYILSPTTSLGLALSYEYFGGKTVDASAGLDNPDQATFDIMARCKTGFLNGSSKLYLLSGMGLSFWHTDANALTTSGSINSTGWLVQPGVGYEFGNSLKFFGEIKLSVAMFTSKDPGTGLVTSWNNVYVPIQVGVHF